jgi:methionine sulfoxide reductase heme-binding subunit
MFELGSKQGIVMKNSGFKFSGTVLVYATFVVSLLLLYMIIDESYITETSRLFLRITGRLGLLMFFISFGASALDRIFTSNWTAYLVRNRRYLGISTAIILWSHFLVILSLSFTAPLWFEASVPWYILFPGSVTFILVGLMALTSNNAAQRKLGARTWKGLHLLGGYAALASFVGEYVLVLYLQPILLPDYVFEVKNSLILTYGLFFVPLLLLFLRIKK